MYPKQTLVCTHFPPWHSPLWHTSWPAHINYIVTFVLIIKTSSPSNPWQLPPIRTFETQRLLAWSQNKYLNLGSYFIETRNHSLHFDPQFGPIEQLGRGPYSYMLSVYLLFNPSLFRHGSNGPKIGQNSTRTIAN